MRDVILSEECGLRPVRFLELLAFGDWRVKVYGIAYGRDAPRPELVACARDLARRVFPQTKDGGPYGAGYLGVNDGRGVNFVFADWWTGENEVHHRVFVSPTDKPEALEEVTATGVCACVWDLRVMCFEREAWLRHVLRNPQGPDLAAYLDDRLDCMA
ncbi:hypothetical protein [Desulfocurvus sp. DL9XJH121]